MVVMLAKHNITISNPISIKIISHTRNSLNISFSENPAPDRLHFNRITTTNTTMPTKNDENDDDKDDDESKR